MRDQLGMDAHRVDSIAVPVQDHDARVMYLREILDRYFCEAG